MLGEAIRTTLENWSAAATVISVLIGGFVAFVGGLIAWFKTAPVTRRATRAAARASDATANQKTVEGLYGLIDRLETRLTATEEEAGEAKAEAQQANQQVGVLRQEHAVMEGELHEIRSRYEALIDKVRGVIVNWSVVRQSADPPDILNDHR